MRGVHISAGGYSIKYRMHLFCPQPFPSHRIMSPTLGTCCRLQRTGTEAFHPRASLEPVKTFRSDFLLY